MEAENQDRLMISLKEKTKVFDKEIMEIKSECNSMVNAIREKVRGIQEEVDLKRQEAKRRQL
jgi:hypothetical protein